MFDERSFADKSLKRYWIKNDRSKVDPRLHDTLDLHLGLMMASHNLSLVAADPEYHCWPNTPKGKRRIHSLPLNGNVRLLFQFDEERGYFFNLRVEDPHKKGGKVTKK